MLHVRKTRCSEVITTKHWNQNRAVGVEAMTKLFDDVDFRIHVLVYIAVNTLLAVIDYVTGPQSTWFYWPLLGWGIGLFGHAFAVSRSQKPNVSH